MARKAILLASWAFIAATFIARSPADAFSHDTQGHVQHTRILDTERRLASPREGWETYQPPLYYLINTLFFPAHRSHIFLVRLLSVGYGAAALYLISLFLDRSKVRFEAQAAVLLFIATTPAFLFMFASYNNDTLATLVSIGMLITAWQAVEKGTARAAVPLGILAAVGLYTKLSWRISTRWFSVALLRRPC